VPVHLIGHTCRQQIKKAHWTSSIHAGPFSHIITTPSLDIAAYLVTNQAFTHLCHACMHHLLPITPRGYNGSQLWDTAFAVCNFASSHMQIAHTQSYTTCTHIMFNFLVCFLVIYSGFISRYCILV
jgi:hypothetical protein